MSYNKLAIFLLFILHIMLLSLPGCDSSGKLSVAVSHKQRVTSPDVAASDLTALVQGNSAFACDLYQALRTADGNIFYSPYSISAALSMTYAGARGETEKQMMDTLHYTLPQDQLHPAFNALDQELASRGQGAKGQDDKGFRLKIANAIWGQKDYRFLSAFLDVLAENYGSGLNLLDFIKAPEKSRITINKWVSQKTEGKITELIPQGVINELTRLVLTNAIYFNAAWLHPFSKESTHDDIFHLLDGSEVTTPMMSQTEYVAYTKGEGYQAIELPYDGQALSMVILLPDAGQFETIERRLDSDYVNNIIGSLTSKDVALTMPKFKFESSFKLKDTLAAMGMPNAFKDPTDPSGADFSGMTGDRKLMILDVVQKAFVRVDEKGTEAAAATAVTMMAQLMPSASLQVTVDRPFIFLIRDIETGAIIFVGRILNPSNVGWVK